MKCPGCGKKLTANSKPDCAECFDLIADLRNAENRLVDDDAPRSTGACPVCGETTRHVCHPEGT